MKNQFESYVIDTIKKIRKEKNISQFQLAEGIGVSSGFIGKVESPNTTSKYNLHHLNLIAQFLDVSPRIFLPKDPML